MAGQGKAGRPRQDVGQALASGAGGELVPSTGRLNILKSMLNSPEIRNRINDVVGSKASGFISSILSAVSANPKLLECEPQSVISAAMVAAQLDLPINQSLGLAHIVPYGNKAQFQSGWRTYVQLAMRTGKYKTIHASDVYQDELQSWNPITAEIRFTDISTWKQRDAGKTDKIAGYLSFFKLIDGFEKYFYMSKAQCMAHGKKFSKTFEYGDWKKYPDAMCLKTVIKLNLSKWGLLSIEMQKAITADQAAIKDDGTPDYIDVPEEAVSKVNDVVMPIIEPAKGLTDLEKKLLSEKTADETKMENIGNEIFEPKGGN